MSRSLAIHRITPLDRGQSELLGFVLLIGLTLAGMTAIVVIGSSALTESQSNSQIDRAEHAMTQLDSKMSLVALGGSTAQQSLMSRENTGTRLYVDESAGWMNISVYDTDDESVDLTVMNVTMGAVVYENEEKGVTIAYQGGGVWRSDPGGASMVSPPEFHYQAGTGTDSTLTLPLIAISGDRSLGYDVSMNKVGKTNPKYPVVDNNARSNPLREGEVNITVHSHYYQAWGRFFESRTSGSVQYDHEAKTVIVTPVSVGLQQPIDYGLFIGGSGDSINFEGAGSEETHLDSYNSTVGNYSSTVSSDGTLVSTGLVDVTSNVVLEGNIRTGDTVEMAGGAEINGSVYWTTTEPNLRGSATITGDTEQISGVDAPPTIGSLIRNEVDFLAEEGDDESLDDGDELTAGEYYVSQGEIEGVVTLNTGNEEEIVIAVDDDLVLDNAKFDVQGNGTVRIYVKGDKIDISNSETSIEDNVSKQLWIYGTEQVDISITNSHVNGVIFAPTGSSGDGTITIDSSEVFGGVVGGSTSFDHGTIHQDHALASVDPLPAGTNIPRVTFLHISVNNVSVTSS